MTATDHTPTEAGTDRAWCFRLGEAMVDVGWEGGEPYVIAMDGRTELINADDHNQASLLEAFRVLHEFLARVTPLRADVAFPSVVPGDTATEADVLDAAWWLLNAPDAEVGTPDWRTARDEWTAHYDRVAGLLATAGTEGETGHDWGGFVSYRAWADGVRWGAEHGRGEWDDAERAWADWTGTIAETVAAEDGPVADSPQGEPQGQGEDDAPQPAEYLAYELYTAWYEGVHQRPIDHQESGRRVLARLDAAAPRVVAPVGNVDREALDELMWQAFKDAQVIHDGADDHDDRFRAPTMFERRRMADVALAALRGEDS
jgi:hypothetical protein